MKTTPESPVSKQPLIIATDKSFTVNVPRINIYANYQTQHSKVGVVMPPLKKTQLEEYKLSEENGEFSRSVISEVVDLAEDESEDNKVNSTDTMSNSQLAGERRIKNQELDAAMKGLMQFIEAKRRRIEDLEEENKGLEEAIRANYKDKGRGAEHN